jgi:hypothetical protein
LKRLLSKGFWNGVQKPRHQRVSVITKLPIYCSSYTVYSRRAARRRPMLAIASFIIHYSDW